MDESNKSNSSDEIATVSKNGSIDNDDNLKYEINNEIMYNNIQEDDNHFPRIKGELGNLNYKEHQTNKFNNIFMYEKIV